jgi:hypothetical protein
VRSTPANGGHKRERLARDAPKKRNGHKRRGDGYEVDTSSVDSPLAANIVRLIAKAFDDYITDVDEVLRHPA